MSDERPLGLSPPHPQRAPHPANGMTGNVHVGNGAYMSIIDPTSSEDGGLEWHLRYGDPEPYRFAAATVLSSYDYLLSDEINMTEATRRLRVLRAARSELGDQS